MSKFLSERLRLLQPYTPGEQPQQNKYIKLNTNESPYPPSPMVIAAINGTEAADLRLYSDPAAKKSTTAIAEYYGLQNDEVIVGNGSDEILAFIYLAFCDCSKQIVAPDISYGFYPVFSALFGLANNVIPLKSDFSIDIDAFIASDKTVILANPNAPTGMALSTGDIKRLAQSNTDRLVIIDEAYVDFGAESAIPLIKECDNLIIVQTFSKSRSLAGARLGFAVSNAQIIRDLNTIKYSFNPYNVNRLTDLAGSLAIKDKEYFNTTRLNIINTRARTESALKKLGCEVLPSLANFIFVKPKCVSAEKYYNLLREKGILVRYFNQPRINEYVRITIGSCEDMATLIQVTAQIIKENGYAQ